MSSKPRITKVTFKIDDVNIDVNYQYIATSKSSDNSKLLVLLPGWSIDANAKSAMTIAKAFSDISGRKTIIIDTKPDEIVNDALLKEAKAVKVLLTKLKPKQIIIAGYSEGGLKAVNLTVLMQNLLNLNIEGLILMESMGLYDQNSKKEIVGGFIRDSLIATPIAITKRVILKKDTGSIKNGFSALSDVLIGFAKEINRTKLNYPKRMKAQIDEMMKKSKLLKEINVPVILIQGINDPVSNPHKLIPDFEKLDEKTNYTQRGSKNPLRERYLKENVFKKSPFIRMLVGKIALPNHIMPFEDAIRIAKASIFLLNEVNKK